ncbi:hypothetical protein BLOT_007833 [Blomia tropicalis]|nr:hypothetical protein BLOT_007833 [Blomia tropicalis]
MLPTWTTCAMTNHQTRDEDNLDDDIIDESINGRTNQSQLAINDEAQCPRNREQAIARKCLRKCNSDEDCISNRKRCLCDGLCGWSCVRPDMICDVPAKIANGRFIMNNGNFFNSKIIYECDLGYYHFGLRERICQGDGTWSDLAPECKTRPLCGAPPEMPHSKHSLVDSNEMEFELNTTVQYKCFNGYELDGSPEAICLHRNNTSNWQGPNFRCIPLPCGDPGEIENGYRQITGYVFSSTVNYYCNVGHILSGRALRECQTNGQWSGDLPTCQRKTYFNCQFIIIMVKFITKKIIIAVKCAQPDDPKNGRAFYEKYTFGSSVTYQCKPGYQLHGPANRTCGADKRWTDDDPVCKIIDCGPLTRMPNGYIEATSTTIGSTIRFFCLDGMVYDGTFNTSTCTSSGQWEPFPFPNCLSPCRVPKIENGKVLKLEPMTIVPHGYQINTTCIPDYEFNNQDQEYKMIECYNGTWSESPECTPARCRSLPIRPKHGIVVAPKTDHGMRAYFKCRDGYVLEGSNRTFCNFGRWNISSPQCGQVYCPFPGYIDNGKVLLIGHMGMYDYRPYVKRVGNNKQIMYECDKGYYIVDGPPGATCVDGIWSPPTMPRCERFYHPKLMRWSRSLRRNKHPTISNTNVEIMARNRRRHKRGHQVVTSKLKVSCLNLPEKAWTKISIIKMGRETAASLATNHSSNDTYPHGTKIKLQCEDGYVLSNPNRTVIKCAKGRWKPELPNCDPASCLTPTIVNGRFRMIPNQLKGRRKNKPSSQTSLDPGQMVKHGSQIELICDHGYQHGLSSSNMKRHAILLKCSLGSWDSFSSSAAQCTPIGCRLPIIENGGYLNGHEPHQMIKHGSIVKYSCDPKYKRSIESSIKQADDGASDLKCINGILEPRQPKCIEINESTLSPIVPTMVNPYSISSTTACHSPQKIENALHYFQNQLMNRQDRLISIVQFDSKEAIINESTMPFRYEHGTEIIFRCVTFANAPQPKMERFVDSTISMDQSSIINVSMSQPERNTWVIRCENGNWNGRSFECDEEHQTLEMLSSEISQQSNVNQLNMKSCLFRSNDPNVWIFDSSNQKQIANWSQPLPHDTMIYIRCRDIGKYRLTGPKESVCRNGRWTNDDVEPKCDALNQDFDYDPEKPPTIIFKYQHGPIAQTGNGKLLVYPGTILHMDCLWIRKHGTPHWSWSHQGRPSPYMQGWSTDSADFSSSLEFRLTIFLSKEQDSGVYTCQTPKSHSHSVEIQVKAVHCPDLNDKSSLVRVTVATGIGDRFNSEVQFNCPMGTTLIGSSTAICLPSGQWSNSIPTCVVTECPNLTDLSKYPHLVASAANNDSISNDLRTMPAEMQLSGEPNSIGSIVVFTCPKGFGLQGSNHELRCTESGQWSGMVPYCQEVRCPTPIIPENGFIEGAGVVLTSNGGGNSDNDYNDDDQHVRVDSSHLYYAGDIVQLQCRNGYMLDGNTISICQETGRWSVSGAKCIPACNYPGVNHGLRLISEARFHYRLDSIIEFECTDGYELRGNAAIKCIGSGQWSGSIPDCVAIS